MGSRQLNRLTTKFIMGKTPSGLHCDGGGLYLQVSKAGTKAWIFRYRSPATGKMRDMGLGPLSAIPLVDARSKATAQRRLILSNQDPIAVRDQENHDRALEAAKVITFSQCATAYIESHKPGWRNVKHAEQWTNTIDTYCKPIIGAVPVQDVDTGLVLKVLEPIWSSKPETASRIRGRIENILDWAKVRGYRSGDNPARWRGHLSQLLPALATKNRVKHHNAMSIDDIGSFMPDLRKIQTNAAQCLEFTILTACRTNEAIRAERNEFDLNNAIWTIPAARMKGKRDHRIPLPARAVEIIRELISEDHQFVFRGGKGGNLEKPLSNMTMLKLLKQMHPTLTVHGFRSTFRDWTSERTSFPHEVCEMAMSHKIPNAAEAAYRRGDLFEKRRRLMEAWAEYVNKPKIINAVITLLAA